MSEAGDRPSGLDALMTPRSVAIIGASDDATRIGGRPLRYLLERGYRGRVYPVNPRRDTVQGLPALASIADAPGPVDLAVVAVPASAAGTALEACAACGVGAAVVFSSGFAEMGAAGAEAQAAMAAIARDSGMRIVGPNCLGVYNAGLGMYATFSTSIELQSPESGPVGVVSQSGAYGAHIAFLARARRVQVGFLITTGNECDVEVAECIEWMARSPQVKVIAASAEGLRDGDALCRALECARRNRKPVVFLKMGRSHVGAEAAMSHTASLAGSDAVYDAVFREFGVHRAQDTDELLDVAYAASFGILPADDHIGLMSVSGGMGIQMADAAERCGLPLVPMPESTQARLRERLPFASPRNPVDITAQVFNDKSLLEENLNAMLEEAGYTSVVAFFTYVAGSAFMADRLIEAMANARERFPDRLIMLCIVAGPEILARYEAQRCPCFEDADRAVRAVAALVGFTRAFHRPSSPPVILPAPARLPADELDEAAAMALLGAAGLPVPAVESAADADAAAAAAARLGFPVALRDPFQGPGPQERRGRRAPGAGQRGGGAASLPRGHGVGAVRASNRPHRRGAGEPHGARRFGHDPGRDPGPPVRSGADGGAGRRVRGGAARRESGARAGGCRAMSGHAATAARMAAARGCPGRGEGGRRRLVRGHGDAVAIRGRQPGRGGERGRQSLSRVRRG